MFHASRATTNFSVVRDLKFKRTVTRNSGRRPGKGRSDEGLPKVTYVLGPDSDDDAGDDSRVVPQVVAPQRVKYTCLKDVLQKIIDRFSAIPLHVSALDSLAVLVYASQKLDAHDSKATFSTFDMFVNTLDANPSMIIELRSAANVVEQFEPLCKLWTSNVQYLLEFFNDNMVKIEQMCNPTFLQEVQSNVQATDMLLRQDPTQELMPFGMEDTHKAVTAALGDNGKDPEENELDVLKKHIVVKLNSENITELEIETGVSEAYKEFLERLKILINTEEIKIHENLGYKHEQWSINFDQHWKTIKSGFKEKLDNEFSDAKDRDHMSDKIRTNVELIFKTILVSS